VNAEETPMLKGLKLATNRLAQDGCCGPIGQFAAPHAVEVNRPEPESATVRSAKETASEPLQRCAIVTDRLVQTGLLGFHGHPALAVVEAVANPGTGFASTQT